MKTDEKQLVIIGGGPAGLAAAVSAYQNGVRDILILERGDTLGGILTQCIHAGFGLHTFGEELTGPEYAARYIEKVRDMGIEYLLGAMVISVDSDRVVTAVSSERGLIRLKAGAVILAMGCRERTRGALNIPGTRPAGVYTAGTAQHYVNLQGKMVGRRVVILGSGDIGLIMARRLTLEGAKVLMVCELMPYSNGLGRNIAQCLEDFSIPLRLSHTVVGISGKERVTGVTIAQVDDKLRPIDSTREHIECDTLLLSVGLIPENELSAGAGVKLDPITGGATVSERLETSVPGVFACGNRAACARPCRLRVRRGGARRTKRRDVSGRRRGEKQRRRIVQSHPQGRRRQVCRPSDGDGFHRCSPAFPCVISVFGQNRGDNGERNGRMEKEDSVPDAERNAAHRHRRCHSRSTE